MVELDRRSPFTTGRRIVGGILVCFFVVLSLACGGFIYYGLMPAMSAAWQLRQAATEVEHSRSAVAAFLKEVQAGRPRAAYEATSEGFKKRARPQQFEELVSTHVDVLKRLHEPSSLSMSETAAGWTGHVYGYVMALDQKRQAEVVVWVVKDSDGVWRVDGLKVDEKPLGYEGSHGTDR